MAAFLRRTAEVYLICDPKWRTPAWRMEALRQVHTVCHEDSRNAGIADVVAFLPPEITAKFGKRLKKMGWASYTGDEWKAYSFPIT